MFLESCFSAFVGIILPVVVTGIVLFKKHYVKVYLLGIVCFVVSQVILRLPLLAVLSNNADSLIFQANFPMVFLFLLAFSAGLFEETGRLVFMRWGIKQPTWLDGIWFGLGHGLIEVVLVYGVPVAATLVSDSELQTGLWIGAVERIFAVLIHVGLSVLVLYGISRKQYRYYLLAIMIHTFVDFVATWSSLQFVQGLIISELFIILVGMALSWYIFSLKKKWRILN